MDEEIERLVVSVRADTAAFARDVASMRGELEGPLVAGAGRAGRMIDSSLARAIMTGKTGFDDLKKVALAAMSDIAQASLRALFRSPGGASFGAGMLNGFGSLVASLVGAPGRATGGPVSGGRGYLVGENGPELFVPSSSGRIEHVGGSPRDVRVAIAIQAPARFGRSGASAIEPAGRAGHPQCARKRPMNLWFTRPDAKIVRTFVKRFDPLHWTVDFPRGAIASVVTTPDGHGLSVALRVPCARATSSA